MITRIIIFLLSCLSGFFLLKYTLSWVSWVGKSQWVENRVGAGATYGMWKIIGILIIILGFLVLIGQIDLAPKGEDLEGVLGLLN